MKCKPIKCGAWSNWHKCKDKKAFRGYTKKRLKGYKYVWHYYKHRTWIISSRFDMSNKNKLSLLLYGVSGLIK